MKNSILIIGIIFLWACSQVFAIVAGSPHDFSPGQDGSMACQFCHTPHQALPGTPLWNHQLSDQTYEIYWSSSLDADVGQPTGSSKLCLSCHDGTVALESTIKHGGSGKTYMSPGSTNLGSDLSDDHPISFVYSPELSEKDPQIVSADVLPEEFHLDQFGEMQCSTCHDPHDNTFGQFLVVSNEGSNMCVQCHSLDGWAGSVHRNSTALVQDADDDYLEKSKYLTVADNGCLSCHQPHSAGGAERLFHFSDEEKNCLSCHNGLAAQSDLKNELFKYSGHFVQDYQGVHDFNESVDNAEQHVECFDCHNSHAITEQTAVAPFVTGALKSVSGVTAEGNVIDRATYEYEVCFKCHGNNSDRIDSEISRQITQTNTLMEFDQANPSFHPVTAQGVNPDVPSLKSSMTEASIIYCTDCHSSDASSSVRGPHASQHAPLLAYRYETADNTQESSFAYELCYQCHDRENILNDVSFSEHKKHLQDDISCATCHDPHGISSIQGNSTNNSHLINFDRSIVFPDPITGRLEYEDLGSFQGRCFLSCHGENHSPASYPD